MSHPAARLRAAAQDPVEAALVAEAAAPGEVVPEEVDSAVQDNAEVGSAAEAAAVSINRQGPQQPSM
jgi:hypothetical protein